MFGPTSREIDNGAQNLLAHRRQQELSQMTPTELYEANLPLRRKLDSHQPLTADEQALHEAICSVVLARMEAQRATELAVRLARNEPNWKVCPCETCQYVRSVLLS